MREEIEEMRDIFFTMDWSYRNPHDGKPETEPMWWWKTENCEEPIGPFETREEAEKDYQEHGVTKS